jgi:nucleotide-binding universal stress UspA family protein
MLSLVLVTLDGSDLAEKALDYATQIVAPEGHIVLLSVVDVPDYPIYSAYPLTVTYNTPDYVEIVEEMMSAAQEYIEKIADGVRSQGFKVKTIVKAGNPVNTILEQIQEEKVDAIVISTHGRSGLSRWLFGSVTQKILQAMPCPVIVVPGKEKSASDKVEEKAVAQL